MVLLNIIYGIIGLYYTFLGFQKVYYFIKYKIKKAPEDLNQMVGKYYKDKQNGFMTYVYIKNLAHNSESDIYPYQGYSFSITPELDEANLILTNGEKSFRLDEPVVITEQEYNDALLQVQKVIFKLISRKTKINTFLK